MSDKVENAKLKAVNATLALNDALKALNDTSKSVNAQIIELLKKVTLLALRRKNMADKLNLRGEVGS